MKKTIFLMLLVFVAGGFVAAQEIVSDEDALFGSDGQSGISTDEDALFGDTENGTGDPADSGVPIEEVTDDQMGDLSSLLLTSATGVEIGGDFVFDLTSSWKGIDLSDPAASTITDTLSLDLGATVYLDARPDEDTRVFAKAVITSPFYTIAGSTGAADRNFEDIVSIKELFTDFNWNNRLFFRAGKQTVNWGVGYFFSPANLLSLSRIDPENPEAELEGPIALKVNYPSHTNNYYLYAVIPDTADSYFDIALAPLAEFVIGNSELSAGAYYQYGNAPAAMTAVTSALGDVSLYGEAYLSYGSDKTFVVKNGGSTTTAGYNSTLFFKGTMGATYAWSDDLSNFNLSFSGQYYFNGEGYEDPDLVNPQKTPEVAAYLLAGNLSTSDLLETGRHYGAASAGWREMLGSDFSLSIFFIENFSSLSGMIKPSVSWSGLGDIDISLSGAWMFGETGEEYSLAGNTASVSLGVSLGGTSF